MPAPDALSSLQKILKTDFLVQGLFVGPPMCDVRHIVMCDVQHIVMQNTLLKLATVFKEHVHAQYVIRFHNVIKRVATMEDSNGS